MTYSRALLIVLASTLAACGPGTRGTDPGGTAPDAASSTPDSPVAQPGDDAGDGSIASVYANTAGALYRVDPDTLAITKIGDFGWPNGGSDSMTDIAIDQHGTMIGVSFGSVYRVDPSTAVTTLLSSSLSGTFNGLSFVPAALVGATGDDVLIGTRNDDGIVFRIDPTTGQTTMAGDMAGFSSSGDLVAVDGFGAVQTADNGLGPDRLVRLASQTFQATPIGSDIGFANIWGVAYWKSKIFGFTSAGEFVLIDPTTGVGTLIQANGPAWWGAAVTTVAPIIP